MRLLIWSLIFSLSALSFQGCKTEDVNPTVYLERSVASFDFNKGTAEVTAVLNGIINEDLKFPIKFTGSATLNTDYSSSSAEIIVKAGTDRGSIVLTGIPTTDTTNKLIIIQLQSTEDAMIISPSSVQIGLYNCSGDRDGDSIKDCDDACPDNFGPLSNKGCPWLGLLINEVHYDPAADLPGDANGDGVRDPLADEFVELFNSNDSLDISGYTLSDASSVRHTFPAGTVLPSKGVIVIFGGGTPKGTFGGALVQTASSGQLNLNNAGDMLTLKDSKNVVLAVFDITGLSDNPDESYTRNPDITGPFEQHTTIPAAKGALFSPGLKIDGSKF